MSVRGAELVANVFSFDGWGGKYRMSGDVELGAALASRLGAETHQRALVLEGGALEVNGEGIALTTAGSLFDRNSERDPVEIEAMLLEALELERVFTLHGALINDHTDGHIDTLVRFVSPHELVMSWPARGDPNGQTMVRIHAQILCMIEDHDLNWTVHQIPSPGVVLSDEDAPLPASYLNFYIANDAVFVPAYGVANDAPARIALKSLFSDRQTYSSPARHLIHGGGAIHCVTHQEPALGESR
ncbi:MAG: agmatine deiminase family protein [Deltaproteobacteria bacterium]|nr:agmatine deiminase family protein [Deltaproteobacteria bacterium]